MTDMDDGALASVLGAYLEGYATYPRERRRPQRSAHRWLAMITALVATLVVVAGTVELAVALHSRSPHGTPSGTAGRSVVSPTPSTSPAAALLPAWMATCLSADGFSFSRPPLADAPTWSTAQAIAAVRAVTSVPSTSDHAAYLHVTVTAHAGTVEDQGLGLLWVVGFDGLNESNDGPSIVAAPSMSPIPSQRVTGQIYFISESDAVVHLATDCQSPA